MIDSGASLNLLMRRTFIEMGLSLAFLTPVQDTFHGIISGQSSMPIGRIDLEVSCGSGENKRRETLTFEVASFDIGYNCILRRPFLLKFMVVIHTAYATIKMPGPKGLITITSDHQDAIACENAALTHARKFGNKEAQDLVVKMAKIQQGNTSSRIATPRSAAEGSSQPATLMKGITVAPLQTSQPPISWRPKIRREPQIRRLWWTPTTPTRSFVSVQSWMLNRNSCSSLFSGKILMSLHGRYQICPGSLGR
jgi:hypothetical protein